MSKRTVTKNLKYVVIAIIVFGPIIYFAPYIAVTYALFGAYDVSRNTDVDSFVLQRYFLGNGVLTWVLSPVNALLDLIALPFINRGVYRLEDLPSGHREEVERLIEISSSENLAARLEEKAKEFPRTMIFFKWYGKNVDTIIDVPAFHEKWKYIQTIGVSVFNKKVSTSRHFGPLRATFRVLYNINDIEDKSAYIVVGDTTSYWSENKLFIFDDTLMHQSVNGTDKTRYCLFVDMVRPAPFSQPFVAIVRVIRFFARGFNSIFYKNWIVLKKEK